MPLSPRTSVFQECRMFHLKAWQCPPILFIVMGFFIIFSMLATYLLAQRYTQEPEAAALTVIFIAVVSLILGTFIVSGFNRLVDAHRIKSQFISLASHQLRSPLSVLKWTLEMGRSDYKAYSPQDAENFINTLGTATENLVKIVDSLLDVNRIEAGTLELKKESLVPSELVRKTLQDFQAAHVAINQIVPEGLPNVCGDATRVIAILHRLIDNALRYTPDKGRVTIRLTPKTGYVVFSVEDSGIGIARADQRRIFEKFFRTRQASQMQTEGAGIGLYIARAVIEQLGGTISFTSQEGKGSQFSFTLPIA